MPDILRIKRRAPGGAAGAPASLLAAEIAFNEADNTLYYGRGNVSGMAANVIPIAGPGGFLPLSGGSLLGPLALAANPTTNLQAAPKQYVDARVRQFNVRLYGATGNGSTDDTAACQACITAAGVGATIWFPAGTYLLSATLNCLAGQHIIGDGPNYTTLHRIADYGDTLKFAQAWDVAVRNLFMTHSTMYGLNDTSLPNRVTSSTAHIRFQNAQGVVVEDCWIWRMPYQILIEDGALIKIHRCNIQGTWDPNFVAAQEGIAGVEVGHVGYTQIISIEHCYFGGSGNGPRDVSWTSADRGTITVSMTAMCGNQYGVRIIQCEDFILANSYLGGNANANFCALLAPGSVNLDWRIIGNFIDGTGATGSMLQFFAQADGDAVTAVVIASNVFNGELQSLSAILMQNITGGIKAVVTNFTITGNAFMATVGSAIMLYNARGGVISGNSITSYNARQVTLGPDLAFCAAVYFAVNTSFVYASGNMAGGSLNTIETPSFCYQNFFLAGAPGTNFAINNVLHGSGEFGNVNGMVREYVVQVSASGNYTCHGNEDVILINKTVSESTQVQLPAGFGPTGFIPQGYTVTIKDAKGDASINGTLLVGTIDNAANLLIATNYGYRKLVWNGSEWNVIGGG